MRINKKVHEKVHGKLKYLLQKLYSEPKIFRATKVIDGKKIVTTEKPWHVYYRFRNPVTGNLDKFIEKKGINRYKKITEREVVAKNLQKALKKYLQGGFNPFEEVLLSDKGTIIKENKEVIKNDTFFTVEKALFESFSQKKKTWAESTQGVNETYYNSFISWLKEKKLDQRNITDLKKRYVVAFLSDILEKNSNTSRNNYKRFLSSIFSQLKQNELILTNFIVDIDTLKSTAKKNKPFSKEKLEKILNYIKENDSYLYDYIKFMWYSFLRPIEIVRLKVENIDLEATTLEIKTKTGERDYVKITEPLSRYLLKVGIANYDSQKFIFTKFNEPNFWITEKEKSREDFFSRRFKKVKKHFLLGNDYGVYSFRHTAALSLYNQFLENGDSSHKAELKLQEIMRHDDVKTTRIYLRDIGGKLPDDWSKNYNYEMI